MKLTIADVQIFRDDVIRIERFIDNRPSPPDAVKEAIKRVVKFSEALLGMDITLEL